MVYFQYELVYKSNKNTITVRYPSLSKAIKERTRLRKEGHTVFSRKVVSTYPDTIISTFNI